MWLFPGDESVLRNLTDILRTDIPRVQHERKIMDPLAHWSRRKRQDVVAALAYGQGPRVKVMQIDTVPLSAFVGGTRKQWGHTPNNSAHTGVIELERSLVRFLEAPLPARHVPQPQPPVDAALRALRRFIRNTLLHELVHWHNNEQGVVWPPDKKTGEEIEAGWEFEQAAKLDQDPFPMFYLSPQRIEDTPIPIMAFRNLDDPLVKALSQ